MLGFCKSLSALCGQSHMAFFLGAFSVWQETYFNFRDKNVNFCFSGQQGKFLSISLVFWDKNKNFSLNRTKNCKDVLMHDVILCSYQGRFVSCRTEVTPEESSASNAQPPHPLWYCTICTWISDIALSALVQFCIFRLRIWWIDGCQQTGVSEGMNPDMGNQYLPQKYTLN